MKTNRKTKSNQLIILMIAIMLILVAMLGASFAFADSFYKLITTFEKVDGNLLDKSAFDKFLETQNGKIDNEKIYRVTLNIDGTYTAEEFASKLEDDLGIDVKIIQIFDKFSNSVVVEVAFGDLNKLSSYECIQTVYFNKQFYSYNSFESGNSNGGVFNSGLENAGEGTVVAVIDSGLDYNHTAFLNSPDPNTLSINNNEEFEEKYYNTVAYRNGGASSSEIFYSQKIPFAFDYGDWDTNVMDDKSDHGTHVAGIAVGDDDVIKGVANKAQLMFCKVADKQGIIYDNSIVAALEDCLTMKVDVVNLSLGSSSGFAVEENNMLYVAIEALRKQGISVVVSSGNDGNSAIKSDGKGKASADNIDNGIVGSPASYTPSLTVANADYNAISYAKLGGNAIILNNATLQEKTFNFNSEILGKETNKTIDYEIIPNIGTANDYNGKNVTNKIAVVMRGGIAFEEKAKIAKSKGASGILIANNEDTDIIMAFTNDPNIPCAIITKAEKVLLDNDINKKLNFSKEYYFYSFNPSTSVGVTSDLTLKPEISGWGTDINSSTVGQTYKKFSGTSMASPNVAGLTAIIMQQVKEKFKDKTQQERLSITNSILMSTALPINSYSENAEIKKYYSPRIQGSGIANPLGAIKTNAYISVSGCNKPKLELGDDPLKTGIYTLNFNVHNFGNSDISYAIDSYVATELIANNKMTGQAYKLSPNVTIKANNYSNGILLVGSGDTVEVTIKLELSNDDKTYLNVYKNGIYVEGFIRLNGSDKEKDITPLGLPFLAFYGDWNSAPLLDEDYFSIQKQLAENKKAQADIRESTLYGTLSNKYYIPLGTYSYELPNDSYKKIYADEDKVAISYFEENLGSIGYLQLGLLRNSRYVKLSVIDTFDGSVVWSEQNDNVRKTSYSANLGMQIGGNFEFKISVKDLGLQNNARYKFVADVVYGAEYKSGNTIETSQKTEQFSTNFYVDMESPELNDAQITTQDGKTMLTLKVIDNHYAQSVIICSGKLNGGMVSLDPLLFEPVYNQERGKETTMSIDITNYKGKFANNVVYLYMLDYAFNESAYTVKLTGDYEQTGGSNGEDVKNTKPLMTFKQSSVEIKSNEVFDAKSLLINAEDKEVVWSTDSKDLVVNQGGATIGQICGFIQGTYILKATAKGESEQTLIVKVVEGDIPPVALKEINIGSYNPNVTLSGRNSLYFPNDFSTNNLILATGESVSLGITATPWNANISNYDMVISCEEKKGIDIANGIITAKGSIAQEERSQVKITLTNIKNANDKVDTSLNVIVVPQVFVQDKVLQAVFGYNGILNLTNSDINYVGKNALVYSPDLTQLLLPNTVKYASSYAFANAKSLNKINIGSITTISQSMFEGSTALTEIDLSNVISIKQNAFRNCSALSMVTLGNNLNYINSTAFAGCSALNTFNIEKANQLTMQDGVLSKNGTMLAVLGSGLNLSGIEEIVDNAYNGATLPTVLDLSGYTQLKRIGKMAFANTNIKEIILPNNLKHIGKEAFLGCSSLTKVTFGSNIEYIGAYAFSGTSISIADLSNLNNYYLGDFAFSLNQKLSYVNLGNYSEVGSGVFACSNNILEVKFGNKVTTIGEAMFASFRYENDVYAHDKLSKIVIPQSVTTIASSAFMGCKNLEIGENDLSKITNIGNSAFVNVAKINTLNLNNLTQLGELAFGGTSITQVSLPKLKEVSRRAFYGATNLSKVELSSSVKTIGVQAFAGAISLDTINLQNVETVEEEAFFNCVSLKTAQLTKAKKLGKLSFYKSGIQTLAINSAQSIGEAAFASCNLKEVALPNTLQFVGDRAFYANELLKFTNASGDIGDKFLVDEAGVLYYKLTNEKYKLVVYPNTIAQDRYTVKSGTTIIAQNAFTGNSVLSSVEMPSTIEVIGDGALYGCANLKIVTIHSKTAPTLLGNYSVEGKSLYKNFKSFSNTVKNLTLYVVNGNTGYGGEWQKFFEIVEMSGNAGLTSQEKIDNFKKAVEALPAINELKLTDKTAVQHARALYEGLTQDERAGLNSYLQTLNQVETQMDFLSVYESNPDSENLQTDKWSTVKVIAVSLSIAVGALLVIITFTLLISKAILNKKKNKNNL